MQAFLAAWYLTYPPRALTLAAGWDSSVIAPKICPLAGPFLGNALNEEVVSREFFLVQVVLWFRARWPDRPRRAKAFSLVIVSAGFALLHPPDRLLRGQNSLPLAMFSDLFEVFATGRALGWVYLHTRNLFDAVGLHALAPGWLNATWRR